MSIQLDERLQACADMVPQCDALADIGCDHGRLGAYLLRQDRMRQLIAVDISAPSLDKCAQLLQACRLGERARLLVGDGLAALRDLPVNGAAICGMGGVLMVRMLRSAPEVANRLGFMVLQPMRSQMALRQFLHANGFCIRAEKLAFCAQRMYHILKVVKGIPHPHDGAHAFSQALLQSGDPLLPIAIDMQIRDYYKILKKIEGVPGARAAARQEQVREQIQWLRSIQ